ncbi:MAG: hypothetical protein H6737_29490 [Alphaproteobacteria bacterium]|nr:hypothetical protein [Alphaproteobacteria bacterium]
MLALSFVLFSPPAPALQLDIAPVELCRRAPLVAIVEVTDVEVRWAEGPRGDLETRYAVHVAEVLRGEAPDSVELVARGGTLPSGLRQWVEDEPQLEVDRRYLALLKPTADGYRVMGGPLGLFEPDARAALAGCL